MTIVINPNTIISAVIMIVALIFLLFILNGKVFSFSWKAFYSLIGIAITGFLLYMGNYAIHQAFDSNSVRIVPSDDMPAENSVSVESYKATYDLFSSQFSQLLTFLGFFGTIFGLVIPAGSYLIQRQTLKDEKDSLLKSIEQTSNRITEVNEKYDKLESFQKHAEEMIKEINIENNDLEHFQHELFMSLQTTFDGLSGIALFLVDAIPEKEKIINLFCMMLISFDNAVNCAVKANNSKGLIHLLKSMKQNIEIYYNAKYPHEFSQAIAKLQSLAKKDPAFVSGKEIQSLLGDDNIELFTWYKELYGPIFWWKF